MTAKLIPRHLVDRIGRALHSSRVVNLIGPRQAGKTTLVRDLLEPARFLTLDDDTVRASLQEDPYGQLALLAKAQAGVDPQPVVLDEIQRLPALTLAIKRLVDADQRPGQFLLTGSSNIFTTPVALDSLAGRLTTLTLRPLSVAEAQFRGPCRLLDAVLESSANDSPLAQCLPQPEACGRGRAIDWIVRGGFPEMRNLPDETRSDRYRNYLDSIVERDIAPITHIRKPDALRRLVEQLAARTGQELNSHSLSIQIGIRKETLATWLDALERLGLIQRLPAWSSALSNREIKSPKIHFMDTGCATAVRGEDQNSFGIGVDPSALGHLLETFVFTELEKSLPFQKKPWRLFHWRQDTREIDIVAESPGKRLALFEVKTSSAVSAHDFRAMDWFREQGPGRTYRCTSVVMYLGDDLLSFGPSKLAVPLSIFGAFGEY